MILFVCRFEMEMGAKRERWDMEDIVIRLGVGLPNYIGLQFSNWSSLYFYMTSSYFSVGCGC